MSVLIMLISRILILIYKKNMSQIIFEFHLTFFSIFYLSIFIFLNNLDQNFRISIQVKA